MPIPTERPESTSAASGVLTPPAEAVRSSADRERRLTEYIRAHTGTDISVRLTPHVPTACVIPTSEEALIESDNADFTDEQARQLVASVDADYLVLISTHPANVDSLPITDQLTADRAQQFGYALHELGHIRYTAIADAATLLEDRIDEEYQEFVHGLWNACEDAAIENQLALDQSQLAADRLELVNRSVSTHAEDLPSDRSAQFTFRDAIEAALYDTGIYDTEVRDVLCDPDDDRAAFASDADRQAFEQVKAGIDEIVATVLSTPDSVERADNVLGWWETDIKPLLDPSHRDGQESEQVSSNGAHDETTADTDSKASSRSSTESPNPDESVSAGYDEQRGEDRANDANSPDNADSTADNESDATGAQNEMGEMSEPAEGNETADPEAIAAPVPDALLDPDNINTDQRQPNPGADVLEYPDLGDTEDATALRSPDSEADADDEDDGASESAERSQSQSSDTADNLQTDQNRAERDESPDISENATSDEDNRTAGDSESSDVAADHETADTSSDFDTGSDSNNKAERDTVAGGTDGTSLQNETAESSNREADQGEGANANSESAADDSGENGEQDDEVKSGESASDAGQTEDPWKTGDSTNQTSLGSFSGSSGQTESGAGSSDESASAETSNESSDSKQDNSTTSSEIGSASESQVGSGDSSPPDGLSDGTAAEPESTSADATGTESESHSESTEREETTEGDSSHQQEDVSTIDSGGEQGEHDRRESSSNSNDGKPNPTPIHVDGDGGLAREGALDIDRDAAHDEANRETPNENALERDLNDVADALEALVGQDGGSGAAPESISELAIMPNPTGANTLDIDERWREATANSEFVADALRKALRESRRDAHRSGVTSGTFDRQRAGALARGNVGAFHVPQYGENKQYDLVILLDRSGSMRRHIETAEDALMRFALACEDIIINVCVIDLYSDTARLIKPFTVKCKHVRESFFSRATGGGTPLADALGLGRELLERRRNSPLVLVVTDGKPGSPEAYEEELARSYAPVCGLTLVLDHPAGSVPDRVARNERFYDRHVYVHAPSQLADRLDQFTVMFDGL